jgi:hypothetical protein
MSDFETQGRGATDKLAPALLRSMHDRFFSEGLPDS